MGIFTDSIVVELFPGDKNPYGIYKEFEFHAGFEGSGTFIRCEAGFRFNGTSMPHGLRWLISPSDPDLLQCASIHDKAFQSGYQITSMSGLERKSPISRQTANGYMAEAMVAMKVSQWKQNVINIGLAIGSGPTWRRRARERKDAVRTDTTR